MKDTKNQILNSIIAIGFAAVIVNTQAFAQKNHLATIPFTFEAGGMEYASGTYEMHQLGTSAVVKITNVDTGAAHVVSKPVPAGGSVVGPKLVFRTTANGYRLSEVWLGAAGMMAVSPSKGKGREFAAVKVAIR